MSGATPSWRACAVALAVVLAAAGCRDDEVVGSEAGSKPSPRPETVEPATPQVVFEGPAGETTVTVELARTQEERQRGLMFRESLASDAGMLFIFDDDRVRSFWMHNTLISLDMVFVDRDLRVVGCVEAAEPQTDTPRTVGKPSRYVVEVVAGFCSEHGVKPGSRIRLIDVP